MQLHDLPLEASFKSESCKKKGNLAGFAEILGLNSHRSILNNRTRPVFTQVTTP